MPSDIQGPTPWNTEKTLNSNIRYMTLETLHKRKIENKATALNMYSGPFSPLLWMKPVEVCDLSVIYFHPLNNKDGISPCGTSLSRLSHFIIKIICTETNGMSSKKCYCDFGELRLKYRKGLENVMHHLKYVCRLESLWSHFQHLSYYITVMYIAK